MMTFEEEERAFEETLEVSRDEIDPLRQLWDAVPKLLSYIAREGGQLTPIPHKGIKILIIKTGFQEYQDVVGDDWCRMIIQLTEEI